MTEEVEVTEEEVAVETPVFMDEAGMEAVENNLAVAQMLSNHLDSGLTTQAEIKKTSVQLRNALLHASRSLHKEYTGVIARRDELLENVGDVQAATKKDTLLKKKAELEAQLAELG
jgi:hypothetical protein